MQTKLYALTEVDIRARMAVVTEIHVGLSFLWRLNARELVYQWLRELYDEDGNEVYSQWNHRNLTEIAKEVAVESVKAIG
jgi:hypothetical protein